MKRNSAPWPFSASAQIVPPCRSTRRRAMASPMPESFELLLGVHALKHSKQAACVLRIETDAVVLDGVNDVMTLSLAAHGDARLRDMTR